MHYLSSTGYFQSWAGPPNRLPLSRHNGALMIPMNMKTLFPIVITIILPTILFADTEPITLGSTTSTQNSGLFSVLLPPFEEETGIRVNVVAVGSGAAIRLAGEGDVDAILVHAPEAEEELVNDGFGINRRLVMHNDFVIVGPSNDPADIGSAGTAAEAFSRIERSTSSSVTFGSRGDDSGTRKKELAIWREAGITPRGRWYKESGRGMGGLLILASELGSYTLSDRGTYLAMKDRIELDVLFEGDPILHNPYHIIAVNPAVYRDVNYRASMRLIAWITSVAGQRIIGEYTYQGQILFHPDAIP